jgi:hypothetical protein
MLVTRPVQGLQQGCEVSKCNINQVMERMLYTCSGMNTEPRMVILQDQVSLSPSDNLQKRLGKIMLLIGKVYSTI